MKKIALALLGSIAIASPALALKGEYGFTSFQFCLNAENGFSGAFQPNPPGGFGSFFATTGTYTFKEDGTGTITAKSVNITAPALNESAGTSGRTSPFRYTENAADGSITIPGGGSFVSTITGGPRAGETATVSNLPGLTGSFSNDRRTLTLTTPAPVIETETFSGPLLPLTEYRICIQSLTATRLP